MTMIAIYALIASSVIASLIRYRLSVAFDKETFPLGTFIANVLSCCILGTLTALIEKYDLKNYEESLFYFNLILIEFSTGVLSTYSSFAYQLAMMVLNKKYKEFVRYGSYTLAFSIVAFALPIALVA